MSTPFIVTLDGPAGVGKSTLAKRVATALNTAYLDTGAMFRTLARDLEPEELSLPPQELTARLAAFSFSLAGSGGETVLACNGTPVGSEIRTETVGLRAARLASIQEVRVALKAAQQELGFRFSLVAEGRDMGTEVFPNASHKIFLDASPEVRARRRCRELEKAGIPQNLAFLTEQIRQRDELDRSRSIAPLRPADDALVIDTSTLSIEDVFAVIMKRISG